MASRSNKKDKYLQKFEIIQWNCRGFKAWKKRSHLKLYLQCLGDMPALIALQEPGESRTRRSTGRHYAQVLNRVVKYVHGY
ncbi:hypothetical protein HPB50_028849 [Hyalomma asiaticum]|nr:hypothetical protein HPB50_028849 [Hyalomma asiaticum]